MCWEFGVIFNKILISKGIRIRRLREYFRGDSKGVGKDVGGKAWVYEGRRKKML